MSGGIVVKTCSICGAANNLQPVQEASWQCQVCGVAMGQDSFSLVEPAFKARPAKMAPAKGKVAQVAAVTWQETALKIAKWGGGLAAGLGLVFALAGAGLQLALTGNTNALWTPAVGGLSMGGLLGLSAGGVWAVVTHRDLGLLGSVATGAIAGLLAAVLQQVFEQLFVFGTSEMPLWLTAAMGSAAGAVVGAMVGLFRTES